MVNPEINQAWESKLSADIEAREEARAEREWHAEILERRGMMQASAQELIDTTGRNNDREKGLPDVYDWQVSRTIRLGKLDQEDEAGRGFGFAWIAIARDFTWENISKKGLFFKYTETVKKPSDKINQVTVVLTAGKEDGTDQTPFDYAHWSITQGDDDEGLTQVEGRLAHLRSVVGLSTPEN